MKRVIEKFVKKGLFITCIVALLSTTNAFASDEVFDIDGSGNVFGAGQSVSVEAQGTSVVENELFAAGFDVNASNVEVDGSAFLAGQTVAMNNTTVGGSIFAAGNNVNIDAQANNNIWAVGNIISLGENTSVKGIHAAGNVVRVAGTYGSVSIDGNQVTIDAVVEGDLDVTAEIVTFTDNAKVLGNLKVKATNDPNAESVAEGEYTFEQAEKQGETKNDSNVEVGEKAVKAIGKAGFGVIILKKVKRCFFNLFKYALMAVILAVVFKKNLAAAYEYCNKKPVPFFCFGGVFTLFFPIMAIICAITVIGLPVAGLASTFYVLSLCFARVFTFGSLVKELIFTHTKKRFHPIVETILAVLPAAIIKEIPVIGGIVGFACAIYTIGYVCLAIYDTAAGNKEVKLLGGDVDETKAE